MSDMRTPDSDDIEGGDAGGVDAGSLADGYGSTDLDEPATDTGTTDTTDSSPIGFAEGSDEGDGQGDDEYGTGSSEDELAADSSATELSADAAADGNLYDVDPGDVASDTDLDLTGDGLVDGADFHEAVTGFFDFGVDETAGHDPTADDVVDDAPEAAEPDLFGLFDG
jgi:hypothetical protein